MRATDKGWTRIAATDVGRKICAASNYNRLQSASHAWQGSAARDFRIETVRLDLVRIWCRSGALVPGPGAKDVNVEKSLRGKFTLNMPGVHTGKHPMYSVCLPAARPEPEYTSTSIL